MPQAREQGFPLRAIGRDLGMSGMAARKYAFAGSSPTKKAQRKGSGRIPNCRRLTEGDILAFQKWDVIAELQHNEICDYSADPVRRSRAGDGP